MFLTVFTPTYNRAHTLSRLYDSLCRQTCSDFEWLVIDDGSTDDTERLVKSFINRNEIQVRYIKKENGGLHTAYNTAIASIESLLNVCVDSDDWMPADAVELIARKWKQEGDEKYAGIIGLDFYAGTDNPVGGYFPSTLNECYFLDLSVRNIHRGDSKLVVRTELLKSVVPMTGFPGEKYFNPVYLYLQVCDRMPLLVLNSNLCFVDYNHGDNMSADIYKQYVESPRSFAKLRLLEMGLQHSTFLNRLRVALHYDAKCLLARTYGAIVRNPYPWLTVLMLLPGYVMYLYILSKYRREE